MKNCKAAQNWEDGQELMVKGDFIRQRIVGKQENCERDV